MDMYSTKDRSAVRPPSRAGSLPQGIGASAKIRSTVRPPSLRCGDPTSQLPQGIGASAKVRSAVRPPSLASQLPQGIGCIRQNQVGCQAAFAAMRRPDKPAPTGDWVHPPKSGRLSGRLRCDAATRQASSHRGLVHPPKSGRLSGRLRCDATTRQACSHRDRFSTRHSRFLTNATQNPYKILSLLPVNLPNRRI